MQKLTQNTRDFAHTCIHPLCRDPPSGSGLEMLWGEFMPESPSDDLIRLSEAWQMEKVGRAVHGLWTKKVQLPGESRRRPLPVSTILCPAKNQQFCRTHLRLYFTC